MAQTTPRTPGPEAAGIRRSRLSWAPVWLALFGAAVLVAASTVQPFQTGPVAFDGAASVLYFERLVSGQRLEVFVNTTPKPLLTIVYGTLFGLTRDWHWISWAAIANFALLVALGARLALRVAGPAAAVAAAIAIAGMDNLLVEVSWAHALPWAAALWLLAGNTLTEPRPRFATAGIAMMLASTARIESFLLLGLATAAIGWLATRRALPHGARGLLLGWLAIPVMFAHDALLTGDPLYWAHVASTYAEGQRVRSVSQVGGMIVDQLSGDRLIIAFAAIGIAWLLRKGRLLVPLSLLAVGAGTATLLLGLAALHLQVLFYYLHPIELALRYGAAFGVACVLALGAAAVRSVGLAARIQPAGRIGPALATVSGAIVALVVTGGLHGPLLGAVPEGARLQAQIDINADRVRPLLARDLPTLPAARPPAQSGPTAGPDPAAVQILVPRPLQTRLAVDLGLSMAVIAPLVPDRPAPNLLHAGQLIYHDRLADTQNELTRSLEGTTGIRVAGLRLDPILVDEAAGIWVWRTFDLTSALR